MIRNPGDSDAFFTRRQNEREHYQHVDLSKLAYYGTITVGVVLGYVTMAMVAVMFRGWQPQETLPYLAVLAAVLVSMGCGTIIADRSRSWVVSGLAYLGMIAGPIGILFGPFVQIVGANNVVLAIVLVAIYVVIVGQIGLGIRTNLQQTFFPKLITGALLLFVVVSFVTLEMQATNTTFFVVLALVGIVIFTMSIAYTFNCAKFIPHTLDNAVDTSMMVFLDSLNIVLRAAAIFFKLKKS